MESSWRISSSSFRTISSTERPNKTLRLHSFFSTRELFQPPLHQISPRGGDVGNLAAVLNHLLGGILVAEHTDGEPVGFGFQLAYRKQRIFTQERGVEAGMQYDMPQLVAAGKALLFLGEVLIDVNEFLPVSGAAIASNFPQRFKDNKDAALISYLERVPGAVSPAKPFHCFGDTQAMTSYLRYFLGVYFCLARRFAISSWFCRLARNSSRVSSSRGSPSNISPSLPPPSISPKMASSRLAISRSSFFVRTGVFSSQGLSLPSR
nr:MAG TPA: hypothetical protein [Caudoviricetes sp.]